MFLSRSKNVENKAIERRRNEEDRLRHFQSAVEADRSNFQIATWENQTAQMMKAQTVQRVAKNIEDGENEKLRQRRQRLALLLSSDDEVYRTELAGLHETSKQKAQRMVHYARQLKQAREDKRQKFAQEMYNRQWREGCDDLRMIDSERFGQQCNEEIQQQRLEKLRMREQSIHEQKKYDELWEIERQKKIQREEEETRYRQAFNYETKVALQQQMSEAQAQRMADAEEQERLRAAFAKQMEDDAEVARQKQAELAEQKRRHMAKITEFNDKTLAAKAETQRRQEEQDARDLAMQLAAMQAESEEKAANKAKMREDALNYQSYLRQRKEEERVMDIELERLVKDEMDRANSKRDMQWMRERLAREQLLKDVYEGRAIQVIQKEKERFHEEHQLDRERQAIEKEIIKAKELQEQEDREEKVKELRRATDLEKQIQANQNAKKIAEAQVLSQMESSLEAERQYRAFIQREKRAAEMRAQPTKNFARKTAEWN